MNLTKRSSFSTKYGFANFKLTIKDLYTNNSTLNKLKSKIFKKGSNITIEPKVIHRMQAVTNCLYLEASTPQNSDVVRLSDDYNRTK